MKKKLIITLLFVKVFILTLFLLYKAQVVYFGEKQALAEEKKNEEEDAKKNPFSVLAPKIKKEIKPEDEAHPLNEKKSMGSRFKGILEDLIELTPLSKEATKEDTSRFLALADKAKKQVDDRLLLIEDRYQKLKDIEKTIDSKLDKISKERDFLSQTIQKEKEIQKERLDALVELFDQMKPQKAGTVIEKMDKDLVVAMFKKLKRKQVTKFLENMSPEKSVEISEYFGRVGSAREYDVLLEVNKSLTEAFNDCKS